MANLTTTIGAIRRMLKDEPLKVRLSDDVDDITEETIALTAGDVTKCAAGMRLEFDDGTGEQVRVLSTDADADTLEGERGYAGSTPSQHDTDAPWLLVNTRFPFDVVEQAVNVVIEADLVAEGLYNINEYEVTSVANSDGYDSPSADIMELLSVYQFSNYMTEPEYLEAYSKYPINADEDLYPSGKVIYIYENLGNVGDLYYVSAKERLSIANLTTSQERIVQLLSAAHLLDWEVPRRLGGPTNQGDRTVRSNEFLQTAAYYRDQAKKMIRAEQAILRSLNPTRKTWLWKNSG